ncbi:MAG: ABC transporter permease [Bacteroidetes bacterium]|nr:ABC transporter permease [Bacteroidota bacterium]
MGSFRGFIVKEFHHIFRDYRTLVILFGMPVIQLILFGYAIRNEVSDIQVGFLDPVRDELTMDLKTRIDASSYFISKGDYDTLDDIERAFQDGTIREAVVFEPDFSHKLRHDGSASLSVIADGTNPNIANTMNAYTLVIVRDFQRDLLADDTPAPAERGIVIDSRMRFNPELKSIFLFVPGLIALILMLVSALMTSITITREKELGTMEILLVSPLKPIQIIVGKVLPYFLLSFINVSTILVLARLVFHIPIRGSVLLLLAECLLFILCALSLGILISAKSKTQQTATMISLSGLLLPTIILSGFIFPIDSMPKILQVISHIVPAKWFLIIIRGIMLKGVGFEYFWKETLILAFMTAVLMTASIRSFKIRLD